MFKKPKVATPVTATSSDKPLPILTNSRLNGRNALTMSRRGFQGLTIRRRGAGTSPTIPTTPTTPVIPTVPTLPTYPTSPVIGGGGGGNGFDQIDRGRWPNNLQLL